jgi:hypothetical protein
LLFADLQYREKKIYIINGRMERRFKHQYEPGKDKYTHNHASIYGIILVDIGQIASLGQYISD